MALMLTSIVIAVLNKLDILEPHHKRVRHNLCSIGWKAALVGDEGRDATALSYFVMEKSTPLLAGTGV